LEFIGPGDVLVCVKLDRLGRSTRDVLNLVHELDQKGAFLRILEPTISTDGPLGKMVLTVLGMVAEMELGFIKARQRDGIEQAKSKGDVYKGRKPTIDRSAVRDLFNEGQRNCAAPQDWPCLRLSSFGIVACIWGLVGEPPNKCAYLRYCVLAVSSELRLTRREVKLRGWRRLLTLF
jgi:DNA invertase Pin-like site-specific DNA recombinase